MRTARFHLVWSLLVMGAPLRAQVTGHLDAGLGGSTAPRLGMQSLWAIAPQLRFISRQLRVDGEGEFRGRGAAGHEYNGTGAASFFVHLPASLLLDLNGSGAVSSLSGMTSASRWDAGARLHLRNRVSGTWFGLSAGRDRFGALDGWEAGLWRDLGPVSIQLQGRRTTGAEQVAGGALILGDSIVRVDSSAQTRVRSSTEVGGWLSYNRGRLELRSGAGWRIDNREPTATGPLGDVARPPSVRAVNGWWTAEGTYWLSDRLGFTGSVGRQAPNPSLLLSPTNFLRLSIRLGLERHAPVAPIPPVPRAATTALTVERSGPWVKLALQAPLVSRVEVMSDLTDWQPVELVQARDGRWVVRLPASPGIHYLNVRYDGGGWQTPPSLRSVTDEFGKSTGLLPLD